MRFANVLGQKNGKALLSGMVLREQVPHALLLVGNSGSGGLAMALALAGMLQCLDPTEDDACGTCGACLKAGKFVHPDIHFSYPTVRTGNSDKPPVSTDFSRQWREALLEKGPYLDVFTWLQHLEKDKDKVSNKQGNITADECLDIIRKLSLHIYEGRYKIVILWRPEYLDASGNRLLKILEEPPLRTVFILVAEHTDRILPTIISRCQMLRLETPTDADITGGLIRQAGTDEKSAEAMAFLADGDFWRALQMAASDPKTGDYGALLMQWMRYSWRGNGADLMDISQRLAGVGKEDQKHFLEYTLRFMRALQLHHVTGSSDLRLPADMVAFIQNFSKQLDWQSIQSMAHIVNDMLYHTERNANPRMMFMDAGIRLHRLMAAVGIGQSRVA
jgi:DNA polymerase-3 subunit delta'